MGKDDVMMKRWILTHTLHDNDSKIMMKAKKEWILMHNLHDDVGNDR